VRGGDFDEDGIPDYADNCPDDYNPEQEDTDGSGIGDICNDALDADGDEWEDSLDNCPNDSNPDQEDLDADEVGDVCDNCPADANPGQGDADTDTVGDACDSCTDTDDDGYGNPGYTANTCPDDNCPDDPNSDQQNADGDETGDVCDSCTDTDDDGYGNPGYTANTCPDDNCPDDPNPIQEDLRDDDGMGDLCDNCPDHPNGPLGGTCTKGTYGALCILPGDNVAECGTGGYCSMAQEDTYPPQSNGIGDACECEGNFDGNVTVDGLDAATFKADYGRSGINRPCTTIDPCHNPP
jgi:hypothetical protein